MNILILGGTRFLGRALVNALRARNHTVTLFNRGQSAPDAFPEVEQIHGDRTTDLALLQGRRWDAAIDTSGYFPKVVRASAEALAGAVDHYTFISSLSVYADTSQPGVDENGRLAVWEDPDVTEITGENYGGLKVLCEQAAEQAMPGRVLVIRPGLIVGPFDSTDRFTYWPHRVARGGEVLAPGRPERGVQFIDVRDLAEWTVRLVEAGATGIYNANTLPDMFDMQAVLTASRDISGSDAAFTWVSEAFLLEQNVGQWMEMPLWIAESDPDAPGFFTFDVSKAVDSGLTFRSIEDTVRATLEWDAARPEHEWRAGMTPEREAELLGLWHERSRS